MHFVNVTLYQISPELDNNHLMFRDLQFIKNASDNKVPAELYEIAYQGELDIKSLEDAYFIFNMELPEGYTGRSMSLSDVIEFNSSGNSRFYFCDTYTFQEIEFNKEKAMQRNNGVKDTK